MSIEVYLTPWERERYRIPTVVDDLFRYNLSGEGVAQVHSCYRDDIIYKGWGWSFFKLGNDRAATKSSVYQIGGVIKTYETIELAMEAADKALIEHGYILVSFDRADKIKLLL